VHLHIIYTNIYYNLLSSLHLLDEDPSTYTNIQGVTSIEIDAESHIDMLNNDQVKKYIDDIDIERSESRRLQEQRPWGIDLVNVTHLWDVSGVHIMFVKYMTYLIIRPLSSYSLSFHLPISSH